MNLIENKSSDKQELTVFGNEIKLSWKFHLMIIESVILRWYLRLWHCLMEDIINEYLFRTICLSGYG